jgi:hypothetical protein
MKQAGQTLVSGVASVSPSAAAGPRRFPTAASVSVEAVVTSSDETVCCAGTSWQLLESDKTLTVRSRGLARLGWVWGLFCAALGCAITVYFATKCSGSSSSSYPGRQCDQAGTLVVGLSLSILLGLVIAIFSSWLLKACHRRDARQVGCQAPHSRPRGRRSAAVRDSIVRVSTRRSRTVCSSSGIGLYR